MDESTETEPLNDAAPRLWLLLLFFLDLQWAVFDRWSYKPTNMSIDYTTVLRGVGCAPEQYRIGVLVCAAFAGRLLHLHLQQVINLSDVVCVCLSSYVICTLLRRLLSRSALPMPFRQVAYATLALINVVSLHWCLYQVRPETMPAILFASTSILLLDHIAITRSAQRRILLCLLLCGIALLQSFCRVDVPFALGAGEFLAGLLFFHSRLGISRAGLLTVGTATGAIAILVQLYLSRVRYPFAHYCGPLFTWRNNVTFFSLAVSCLFLLPVGVGIAHLIVHRSALPLAARVLLCAASLHLALYVTLGNVVETRIFVPFVFALAPWLALSAAAAISTSENTASQQG